MTVLTAAYTVWLGVTALLMIGVAIIYLFGSNKMAKVFLRVADSIKTEVTQGRTMVTSVHESTERRSPSFSEAELAELENKAAKFDDRATRIVRCGRQIACGFGFAVICMGAWTASRRVWATLRPL